MPPLFIDVLSLPFLKKSDATDSIGPIEGPQGEKGGGGVGTAVPLFLPFHILYEWALVSFRF